MVEVRPGGLQRLLQPAPGSAQPGARTGRGRGSRRSQDRRAGMPETKHHVAGAGAGGHRRAPLLEIAVNRLDPDDSPRCMRPFLVHVSPI